MSLLPRKTMQLALSAFTLSLCLAGSALAQSILIRDAIDETRLVSLTGNTRPEVKTAIDNGAVADDFRLEHMLLLLRRPAEQQQALDKYVEELSDPQSPNFHRWLTAAELGKTYGPAEQDRGQITAWLESHGFRVNTVYPNGTLLDFSGTAEQVRAAFHTEIHEFIAKGELHHANVSDPQIPAALAPAVVGIAALNDFRPHTMYKHRPEFTFSSGGQTQHAIVPADLATIYNIGPLFQQGISGQGQTIVLLEDTDFSTASDWSTFRSRFGLSGFTGASLTTVHPAPPSGSNNCSDPGFITGGVAEEAILDVEWASAAAPSATIEMASCSDTFTDNVNFGGLIALTNLLNASTQPPAVVSISYGDCEPDMGAALNATFRDAYQQAAAEGVSVFVAAGDEGAASCDAGSPFSFNGIAASGFASTAFNVAVGGTDFGDTYLGQASQYWNPTNSANFGSAISYMPEIPWNESCASELLAEFSGFATTYGASGFCNSSAGKPYQRVVGGSGAPSGCATGTPTNSYQVSGTCQGWPKPSWQSVVGNPKDGVRDLPDVSLFAAAFGTWGHYYILCYSNTSDGGNTCGADPSTWSKAGGTSFSSPIMAGIQALVNQKNGRQGNPNPVYYQLAAGDYGASGSAACNSNNGPNGSGACTFHDITLGDNAMNCALDFGDLNCYDPGGAAGSATPQGTLSLSNTSNEPAYRSTVGWDFASGLGSVNAFNLVNNWSSVNGPPPVDFSLSASPASQSVTAGSGTSYSVTTTAENGFAGSVALTVSGLPSGATGTFNPTSIGGSGTSTLTIATTAAATPGTYTLTITGSSGALSHTASVTLVVTAAAKPDFTIAATPASQTVTAGSGTTYTVTTTAENGFAGSVALTVSGLPSGATGTFNPTSIGGSGSSTLTIATTASVAAGTYTLTITGASGSLNHTASVKLIVSALTVTSYEAEASGNTLSGKAAVAACTTCSGGKKVRFIGDGAANYVIINKVSAASAGSYTLTVYGVVDGTRSFSVSVNGAAPVTVSCTGKSWEAPVPAPPSVTVTLKAGSTNTIKFYNNSAYAPDLDRITIH